MMRKLAFFLFLLVSPLTVSAGNYPAVNVQKINDHIYAMLGGIDVPNKSNHGYVNNILVIIGDAGVILVDAGSHKGIAKHIDKEIKKITSKPVTDILVTHHHGDHHLGASYFDNARVTASEYCAEQIRDRGASLINGMSRMTGMNLSDTKAVVPSRLIPQNTRKHVNIQGVEVELITPAIAHTPGDMMVYLPNDGVLASGDVLVHGVNPNIADGNLKSWLAVMDDIRQLPLKAVMPGHGDIMQPSDIAVFQDLMNNLYNTVAEIYEAGGDMSQVREGLDIARWQQLSRFDDMMGRNISAVWLQVEADSF